MSVQESQEVEERQEYVVTVPTGYSTASAHFRKKVHRLSTAQIGEMRDHGLSEDGIKLMGLNSSELQQLRSEVPGLVVEPNIRYGRMRDPFFDRFNEVSFPAASSGTYTVTVVDEAGAPVPEATVFGLMTMQPPRGVRGVTDSAGQCTFTIPASLLQWTRIAVYPKHSYWNIFRDSVSTGQPLRI